MRSILHFAQWFVVLSLAVLRCSIGFAAEPSGTSVISLDKPFTFSYLAWEGKARIANGEVQLDAAGLTPKGGAGVMTNSDLGGQEDDPDKLIGLARGLPDYQTTGETPRVVQPSGDRGFHRLVSRSE